MALRLSISVFMFVYCLSILIVIIAKHKLIIRIVDALFITTSVVLMIVVVDQQFFTFGDVFERNDKNMIFEFHEFDVTVVFIMIDEPHDSMSIDILKVSIDAR
jgi:hypothetical protein